MMKKIKKCWYERVSRAKGKHFILLTAYIRKIKGRLIILNVNFSLKMFWKMKKIKNDCMNAFPEQNKQCSYY